jgi:hypothetical protein
LASMGQRIVGVFHRSLRPELRFLEVK